MKDSIVILIKTFVLVLTFVSVLGISIFSLSFLRGDVRQNNNAFLTPEHAVAAPTAQELLQQKFDAYNAATEEDGKRVVTVFSEEQIKDFSTRRNNNEWFWLSSEEMLFLIDDTVKLFADYDTIRIRTTDGEMRNFDSEDEVYDAILERASVLSSAKYTMLETEDGKVNNYTILTNVMSSPTEYEKICFASVLNPWLNTDRYTRDGVLIWSFCNSPTGKYIYTWSSNILTQSELFGVEEFWEQRITVYSFE